MCDYQLVNKDIQKGGDTHKILGKIAQSKHSNWLLVLKKTMRIDKMFIQIVKMSLQDFKAKKEEKALRQRVYEGD